MDMESMERVWLPALAVNSPRCSILIVRQASIRKARSLRPTLSQIVNLGSLGWTAGSQAVHAQRWPSMANLCFAVTWAILGLCWEGAVIECGQFFRCPGITQQKTLRKEQGYKQQEGKS